MPIAVKCEMCTTSYNVNDKFAGKKFKCKECGAICHVPGSATSLKARTPPPKKPVVQEDDYGDYDESDDDSDEEEQSYEAPRKKHSAAKTKTKTNSKTNKEGDPGGGSPWIGSRLSYTHPLVFLVVPSAFALLSFFVTGMANRDLGVVITVSTVVLGSVMIISGRIRNIIKAFQDDPVCGFLFLFLPFYGLYHVITRWNTQKDAFMMQIIGSFIIVTALFPRILQLFAFVRAVDAQMAQ